MWDIIASNRRRSLVLVTAMGLLLILLGAAIGVAVELAVTSDVAQTIRHASSPEEALREYPFGIDQPSAPRSFSQQLWDGRDGLLIGMGVALLIWFVLWLTALGAGDDIVLATTKAHAIKKEDAPQLWNVVEEMTIAAGLPKMPRVYLIDDPALNAFAVGRRPEKAALAVTSGLLKRLNRDELQGVIGHEIGHIRNLDIRFMTLATVMMGAIVLLAELFLRGLWYGGGGRRSSKDSGGAAVILLIVAILLAILAPVAAQLLYFACSRRREYLADASSARFTRFPEGLASALDKISGQAGRLEVSKAVAPLCIVNPLEGHSLLHLLSTHPPTAERISILRKMAGAGWASYETAFQQVHGRGGRCISDATVQSDSPVEIRPPSALTDPAAAADDATQRAQQVGRLLDQVTGFAIIGCSCGLRLKLPPGYKADQVTCPRCGKVHAVPSVGSPAARAGATGGTRPEPMRYRRRGTGWETITCRCGHTLQLSPSFVGRELTCPKCRGTIQIDSTAANAAP